MNRVHVPCNGRVSRVHGKIRSLLCLSHDHVLQEALDLRELELYHDRSHASGNSDEALSATLPQAHTLFLDGVDLARQDAKGVTNA